jgi:hypothetical protein
VIAAAAGHDQWFAAQAPQMPFQLTD